jgi:hypothetical protein
MGWMWQFRRFRSRLGTQYTEPPPRSPGSGRLSRRIDEHQGSVEDTAARFNVLAKLPE